MSLEYETTPVSETLAFWILWVPKAEMSKLERVCRGWRYRLNFKKNLYKMFAAKDEIIDNSLPLRQQKHINSSMRAEVVEWLFEVNVELKLESDIFFMSVALMDCFTRKVFLHDSNSYQLVGMVCHHLARKMELDDFDHKSNLLVSKYFCDDQFSVGDLVGTESFVLKALDYSLCLPTILLRLEDLLMDFPLPPNPQIFCRFLAHQTCLHDEMMIFPCMLLALALYCYVADCFGLNYQDAVDITPYTWAQLSQTSMGVLGVHSQVDTMARRFIFKHHYPHSLSLPAKNTKFIQQLQQKHSS